MVPMEDCAVTMPTKPIKSLTALLLLACCAFVPACDILGPECNPNIQICEFEGNHPGTLDPSQNN